MIKKLVTVGAVLVVCVSRGGSPARRRCSIFLPEWRADLRNTNPANQKPAFLTPPSPTGECCMELGFQREMRIEG